jgi:hypothetical protein
VSLAGASVDGLTGCGRVGYRCDPEALAAAEKIYGRCTRPSGHDQLVFLMLTEQITEKRRRVEPSVKQGPDPFRGSLGTAAVMRIAAGTKARGK